MSAKRIAGKLAPQISPSDLGDVGASRAVATTQIIGADHEKSVGIERAYPGPMKPSHQPSCISARPAFANTSHVVVEPGGVLRTGHRMKQQNRVIAPLVERAVGFVGERELRQLRARVQP